MKLHFLVHLGKTAGFVVLLIKHYVILEEKYIVNHGYTYKSHVIF